MYCVHCIAFISFQFLDDSSPIALLPFLSGRDTVRRCENILPEGKRRNYIIDTSAIKYKRWIGDSNNAPLPHPPFVPSVPQLITRGYGPWSLNSPRNNIFTTSQNCSTQISVTRDNEILTYAKAPIPNVAPIDIHACSGNHLK